ncbi:MAG: AIR synthase family protein, partial [Candidatus Thorarchaeota archaeon]|nr:AIR synthase family protein [Candidatus Thorarchaeota archaeon]
MLPGKVPPEILESHVFKHLGKSHPDLILGPSLGQDASVIRFGDRVLIASTDPITGSVEDIGWLAVHINANDIATFGVQPIWFLNSIMLPVGSTPSDLEYIMTQIHEAASSLNITVAGGHTEVTGDIDKPIIAGFMLGETSPGQYVTSSGAKAGDSIILTKSIAIEGTAILASEGRSYLTSKLGSMIVDSAIALRDSISVVREGVASFNTGHITAMHDPTEGGISNGIHELCNASGVGFRIIHEAIPVHHSTKDICDFLGVNPLNLISSGCMLMTCHTDNSEEVMRILKEIDIEASVIG